MASAIRRHAGKLCRVRETVEGGQQRFDALAATVLELLEGAAREVSAIALGMASA